VTKKRPASKPLKPSKQPVKKAVRKPVSRWQIVLLVVLSLFVVLLLAFVTVRAFREELDELYYKVYAKLYVDAPLTQVAIKKANIPYCGTTSRFQKLDLYLPHHTLAAAPLVVYIHGGGWSVGDKSSSLLAYYGQSIVQRGFALASVNYRLAPHVIYPTQNNDVACAVSYLRDHAAEYGINSGRIGLIGDSAGGQLAALTAFNPEFAPNIKAVVQFYSPADLWVQVTRKPHIDKRVIAYLGSSANQKLARQASPLYAPVNNPPPFLLFHGTNDQTVAYSQSVAFAARLRAVGGQAVLQPVHNANHNFSANSSPTAAQIRTTTADFFEAHLRRSIVPCKPVSLRYLAILRKGVIPMPPAIHTCRWPGSLGNVKSPANWLPLSWPLPSVGRLSSWRL
jgi:acetyl esterase/lipase